MGLLEVLEALGKEFNPESFGALLQQFYNYILEKPKFGVIVDDTPNFGHQSNTVFLLRRLIEKTSYTKKVWIIINAEKPDDDKIREKLLQLLPFFDKNSEFMYPLLDGNCCKMQAININDMSEDKKLDFVFSGGFDKTDDATTAKILGFTDQFLVVQPYNWEDPISSRYIYKDGGRHCIVYPLKRESPLWFETPIHHPTEDLTFPAYLRDQWLKQCKDLTEKAEVFLDKLRRSKDHLCIIPVYGLHQFKNQSPFITLFLLTLSVEFVSSCPGSKVVVVFFNSTDKDDFFALSREFFKDAKDEKEEAEKKEVLKKYITDLFIGSGDPINFLVDQLLTTIFKMIKTKSIKVSFDTSIPVFDPNSVYAYQLGRVPKDYFDFIYTCSITRFSFFEGQGTSSLMMSSGIPFIQCPVSIDKKDNYPALSFPDVQSKLAILISGLGLTIGLLIKNLSVIYSEFKFFFDNCTGGDYQKYFTSLKAISLDKRYDKFNLSVIEMMGIAQKSLPPPKSLSANSLAGDSALTLQQIYQNLTDNYKNDKIDFSVALPDTTITKNLNTIFGTTIIDVHGDITQTDSDVTISGAGFNATGLGFSADIKFTYFLENIIQTDISANADDTSVFNFPAIPWLGFENTGFNFTVREGFALPSGYVFGTLKNTELKLKIDIDPSMGVYGISGDFEKPVTALDAFYALAGGINFIDSLPGPLRTLGGFGLKNIQLKYDPKNSSVGFMSFTLTTDKEWVLWEKVFSVTPSVTVSVYNPADLQNRKTSLSVSGEGKILDTASFSIAGTYPPFEIVVQLEKGSVINLTDLIGQFGLSLDLKSSITALDADIRPSEGYYYLSASLESDWEIIAGFIKITGLSFNVIISETNYYAFGGSIALLDGKLNLITQVAYSKDGWSLSASTKPDTSIAMSDLASLINTGAPNNTPSPNMEKIAFSVSGIGKGADKKDWELTASTSGWAIDFLNIQNIAATGTVGSKKGDDYCSLSADITWNKIDLTIKYEYAKNQKFYLAYKELTVEVTQNQKDEYIAETNYKNLSIGEMVETAIGWVTGAKFGLDSPWDMLNKLSFDFNFTFNFSTNAVSISAKMDVDLVFAKITGITLTYEKINNKWCANVSLDTSSSWLGNEPLPAWDASVPGSAPVPEGKGAKYFDLRLLALGQQATIPGIPADSVDKAVEALDGLADVDADNLPEYNGDSALIIGANFGILKDDSNQYLLNAKLIFNDPLLYGLKLSLDSEKAGPFKGLAIEILYAKLNDSLGVFKARAVFPDSMRYLSIGAYSITLPCFALEIYTNGDFTVDLGFPWNSDFSCSFAISGIIAGIPFTGSAGLYFGKLSSDTAQNAGITELPVTSTGDFNPVIVLGFGFKIGIGKSFSYGILSGGFSLTFMAILEGIIAKFNPYKGGESTYFYMIKGTLGVNGQVYGIVDFKVITASITVSLGLRVSFIYISYKASEIEVSAYLRVSASLTINLWIVKIKLSFSFNMNFNQKFIVGEASPAPWDHTGLAVQPVRFIENITLNFSNLNPPPQVTPLRSHIVLSVDAVKDEYGSSKLPVAVILLTLPEADFEVLCKTVFYWVTAAGLPSGISDDALENTVITQDFLEGLEGALDVTSIGIDDITGFLSAWFKISVMDEQTSNKNIESVCFPAPASLKVETNAYGDLPALQYALKDVNTVPPNALAHIKSEFEKLAFSFIRKNRMEDSAGGGLSMAEIIFADCFSIMAKQAVKTLSAGLRSFKLPIDKSETPSLILSRLNADKKTPYTLTELFESASDVPITAGVKIFISGDVSQPVETNDTLALFAGRNGTTVENISQIDRNGEIAGLFNQDTLTLSSLQDFTFAGLLQQAVDNQVFSDIKGMLSRCLLGGLRVPTDGIEPLTDSMWVINKKLPKECGIFALTGQQMPIPADYSKGIFTIHVSAADDLAWFEIPQHYSLSISKDQPPTNSLKMSDNHADGVIVENLMQFASKFDIRDMQCEIIDGEAVSVPYSVSFGRPYMIGHSNVFMFPDSLIDFLDSNPDSEFDFLLEKYTTSDENKEPRDLNGMPAVQFDFSVRNIGLAISYILTGTSSKTLKILDKVIMNPDLIAGLDLFYTLNGQSVFGEEVFFNVAQIDLSTEERPLQQNISCKNEFLEMLVNLKQAFITNNGGYVFTYKHTSSGSVKGLPDELFNEQKEASVSVLLKLNGGLNTANAVYSDIELADGETLLARSKNKFTKENNWGVPCIARSFNVQRVIPEEIPDDVYDSNYAKLLLLNSYSLLRVNVNKNDTVSSAPIQPNINDRKWEYGVVIPCDNLCGGKPYGSYGGSFGYSFDWLDCYGNVLIEPFPDKGNFTGQYSDTLFGLSSWSGIKAEWCVSLNDDNKPSIEVIFNFMSQSSQATDINSLQMVLSQINDVNVVMTISSTIASDYSADKDKVIQWINAIIDALNSGKGTVDPYIIIFPVDGFSSDVLKELACSFTVARKGAAAQGYENVTNILTVTGKIPYLNEKTFADKFEGVFSNAKVLSNDSKTLYGINKKQFDVAFKNEKKAVFAARPVSLNPESRNNITVNVYKTGEITLSFKNIDLNVWLRNTLAFFDGLFNPETVSAINTVEDKLDIKYKDLLDLKKNLADCLLKYFVNVIQGDSDAYLDAAKEKAKQLLLREVSDFYKIKAVCATGASAAITDNGLYFFGGIYGDLKTNSISLTDAELKGGSDVSAFVFAILGDDLVKGQNSEIISYLDTTLSYKAAYLNNSGWYNGVTGELISMPIDEFDIPFPITTFPETPVMQKQGQVPLKDEEDIKNWNYFFVYSLSEHYPQSEADCKVIYNGTESMQRATENDAFFNALAAIISSADAINADITEGSAKINQNADIGDITDFNNAITAAYHYVTELSKASVVRTLTGEMPLGDDINAFIITESEDAGDLVISINMQGIVPYVLPDEYEPEEITGGTFKFKNKANTYLSAKDGQLVKERMIKMPSENIFKKRNAISQILISQNSALIPGKTTNPDFVFKTGIISFGNVYTASCDIDRIDLSSYYKVADKAAISNYLTAFFNDIIDDVQGIMVQAELRYIIETTEDKFPSIELPLFMQLPVPINQDSIAGLSQSWENEIYTFRNEFKSGDWTNLETLAFSLIFSTDMPILKIKRAVLNGEKIQEKPQS
jgi:hypothetical protein